MIHGSGIAFAALSAVLLVMPSLVQAQAGDSATIDFVKVEIGTFDMGSPASEVSRARDENQHQAIAGSFYISKREVTQDDYQSVIGANPSRFKGPNLPVERVSWLDAIFYCNARSELEGLTPVYTIQSREITWDHEANGYRLPTEAEWEYACRAGTTTVFSTGNTITTSQANFDGNYPYNRGRKGQFRQTTTPVMSFAPNAWGLYDMHGNVFEWCWDQYSPDTSLEALDGSLNAPAVMRGGSWYSEARFLRSANRSRSARNSQVSYIGFRVVRNAE
jgi:formylglycine-generating enzyme required for sulfatase activity